MTKEDRTDKHLEAARANAESLLQSAVTQLRQLVKAPGGDAPEWFPNGIDGIKISIKAFQVELSLELEGAAPENNADAEAQ